MKFLMESLFESLLDTSCLEGFDNDLSMIGGEGRGGGRKGEREAFCLTVQHVKERKKHTNTKKSFLKNTQNDQSRKIDEKGMGAR